MYFKHYILLLLAANTCITTFAQPRIKDQGVIGGNLHDVLSSLYLTNDKGVIVGGYSNSKISDQKTENTRGRYDYWVVKLDSNNAIQWDKTIGGSDHDFLQALQQTADGGYILGGTSSSNQSGDKTDNLKGFRNYWVIKLNNSGVIQWDKTFGGSSFDELSSIRQTSDGGYILGGYSFSGKSGDKTGDSRGGYDFWIVKLDVNGNIQWDKTIGGSYSDELVAIQQTTDNGYILGGWSDSPKSGEKTEDSQGDYDYWIVKLDVNGTVQWDKTVGGSSQDYFYALEQTTDGGYITGGASYSGKSGDKTQYSRGSYDYWIVKLDATGNIQWDKTIGGSYNDYLTSLGQTADDGFVLGGYSASNSSGEKTENSRGGYDYWIIKLNSLGKVQWDKTIGGSNDDGYYKVIVKEIKRNDYVIGGSSYSGISGDKTSGNRGGKIFQDYWMVELRYLKPDSIAIAQAPSSNRTTNVLHNNTLRSYPNPARDKLTIQSKEKATFVLTTPQGKVLLTKVVENTGVIDVSHIPSGIYYLTNTTSGIVQKIMISR